MLEDKIARKMADMFSDSRINVYVLAAMTRRYMNAHIERVITEWWDLHNAEASTYMDSAQYVDSKQIKLPFDVGAYDVMPS
jgi:hypothetical protein